eukprot:COSAG06_NODE_5962_length_3182_cov_11.158936_4_plen_95_part_00
MLTSLEILPLGLDLLIYHHLLDAAFAPDRLAQTSNIDVAPDALWQPIITGVLLRLSRFLRPSRSSPPRATSRDSLHHPPPRNTSHVKGAPPGPN